MKALFKSDEYEVLSMEGLNYETNIDCINQSDKNTHVPLFDLEKEMYVLVNTEIRKFIPKLIRYGFRYYDNDGILSKPFTAIICKLEGENNDCAILARYAQSPADDYWDSLSPYSDVPCGHWNFWSSKPDIFFSDRERTKRLSYSLLKVKTQAEIADPNDNTYYFGAFRYNPNNGNTERVKVEVQELSYEPNGQQIIRSRDVDEGNLFWTYFECIQWYKKNQSQL